MAGFDSWCADFTRFNVWPYDRLDAACTEPATHTVQADNGDRYVVCDGRAPPAGRPGEGRPRLGPPARHRHNRHRGRGRGRA